MVSVLTGYGLQGENKKDQCPHGEHERSSTEPDNKRRRLAGVHGLGVHLNVGQLVAVHVLFTPGTFHVVGMLTSYFTIANFGGTQRLGHTRAFLILENLAAQVVRHRQKVNVDSAIHDLQSLLLQGC
jgi:hypothetical protein